VPLGGPIYAFAIADDNNVNPDNEGPFISTEEIRIEVSRLTSVKATGLDGIPDILDKIYNRSLRESVFWLGGNGPDFYFCTRDWTSQSLTRLAFGLFAY